MWGYWWSIQSLSTWQTAMPMERASSMAGRITSAMMRPASSVDWGQPMPTQ